MTKIKLLPKEQASQATKELYSMLKSKIGKVPNVYKIYGYSHAALKANLVMDDALSNGELSAKEIEVIALTVSQFNNCDYCLAAHTAVGKMYGMTDEETINTRKGEHSSKKAQSLIDFTKEILNKKGKIEVLDLNKFYQAGYNNAAVVEVVGQIAKNFFNNYTNHIAGTEIDFPQVKAI